MYFRVDQFKGMVHQKKLILSSFTHFHVNQNLYDFIYSEQNWFYEENHSSYS